MRAMIVSFLGEEEDLIKRRLTAHNKQIKWFLEADPRIEIRIVAQCYDSSWYYDDPRVSYIKLNKRIMPSPGKNMMLEEFYDSDIEWGILLDNDSVLYPYNDAEKVFTHIIDNSKLWKNIDMWWPISPMHEPFRYMWEKDVKLFDKYFVFKRSGVSVKGSIFVLRNFSKQGSHKTYFQDRMGPNFSIDDTEFVIENIIARHSCYKCLSLILQEYSTTHTTLDFVKEQEVRKKVGDQSKELLAKIYKNSGLKLSKGKFQTKEFFMRNWLGSREILVPKNPKHVGLQNLLSWS